MRTTPAMRIAPQWNSLRWLGAAPYKAQHRRAVARGHRVDASFGTEVEVAGGDLAVIVGGRSFDDENQLVACMAMACDGGTGLEARQQDEAPRRVIAPDSFDANSGNPFFPGDIAQAEDLSLGRVADLVGRFQTAGKKAEHGGAVAAVAGMYTSARPVTDVAGIQHAAFVEACSFDSIEQFVADVPMHRELPIGPKPRQYGLALRGGIGPQILGP